MLASLRLKKNEERRIKQGHLWVFSNEVDIQATPLKDFEPGQQVIIEGNNGKPLGMGYVNPKTLICARILSRSPKLEMNLKFLKKRIQAAQALRELSFDKPFYRLIFAEADGLPGLVIDRFGDVFSVQISTAGMEAVKDDILQVLENLYHPQAIVLKNELAARELEGLPLYEEVIGELPENLLIEENTTQFAIPVQGGQKTGWFYDHRQSRARLQQLVEGKRVLDVFSYLGGWGVACANAGAEEVTCIDASEFALDGVDSNAQLNGVQDKVITIQGNAFDVLNALKMEAHKYDVVIVDPPAFIKRKKDFKQGFEAYKRINQLAMRVLEKDGILVSASCSHHLTRDQLLQAVQSAGRHIDRQVQLFDQGHQGPDHPVHPAIPETEYIKTLFFKVGASW
ncbi:class I SAM-dependent rRNA methyltransferase [Thiomicrorhabdus sp. 6S2-11]|uniref:Class I SAM-dependent rRNA methyltransferase n=1 Tax=Thiomicrorhabdus marina TaxID=2818442 RepID=A0ABS3Q3K4_9GAMM|nr:class I SAM-dependent rRNA methyltransferase [Thiomicrorhabdus marina]MBO1926899.1 class I SAM-dependent rRNA methyltransferase [Thiomicrorhabdus marina]